MEGRFNFDWYSLIVGRKLTVFPLFYYVFEGNFQIQARGGYIWTGDLTEGFLHYRFGAYIWKGLYTEELIFGNLWYFYVFLIKEH